MPVVKPIRHFKGNLAKLGSILITDDHEVAFFVGYVNCACKRTHKLALTPEESRTFAKRFYRENETKIQKFIAAPGRAIRHLRLTLKEASKLASSKERQDKLI